MISVKELLNSNNITICKETSDNYVIKCLHPENHKNGDKNPSFSIKKDNGLYHCWSCHASGNIYTLHKLITGQRLQDGNAGFSSYLYTNTQESKKPKDNSVVLIEGKILPVEMNEEIMDFLISMGVYSKEFIRKYKISYTNYCKYQAVKGDKDPIGFFKRILFPIYRDGKLISVEARDFTKKEGVTKVLYPRDSITDHIFNIENVDPTKPLIIVEGIKDLSRVWNYNRNVVSIFTSNFSETKLQLLKDKGFTDNIILFIDNDNAGRRMADLFFENPKKPELSWEWDFKVAMSDIEGEDPNDCSIEEGKRLIENADWYSHWLIKDIDYIGQKKAEWEKK